MILEVDLGKYKANSNRVSENIGIFVRRSNGKNGVMIDDDTILVAERNSMHALNGDKVRVEISASRKGQEPEAKAIEILSRKTKCSSAPLTWRRTTLRSSRILNSLPPTS